MQLFYFYFLNNNSTEKTASSMLAYPGKMNQNGPKSTEDLVDRF